MGQPRTGATRRVSPTTRLDGLHRPLPGETFTLLWDGAVLMSLGQRYTRHDRSTFLCLILCQGRYETSALTFLYSSQPLQDIDVIA